MDIYGRDLTGQASRGDLEIAEALENLKQAIRRRLETPPGALFAHPDYGFAGWDLLGQEMDEAWATQMVAAIRETLEQEPRIERLEVSYELNPESRTARFTVYFSPIAAQVTENLVWEVAPLA